eukprot:CAMPEP_0118685076 /NCGR_PEP_ID=MMETSP0800-20121206/7027_1 /TAXON_ID=210618 ORGANISM="Striatella unipunctata, Strain CCMP2910" /NCGR_SAMPLE_ID=MMETSP0800 /ASSEMBLY_ACC=CAM_ASM_000638 /LENGTH=387 /DNA_ID=CAMNT_0006581911 /DNA_START=390 /DNA_END=1553 /DNA_ORIENTATION=+
MKQETNEESDVEASTQTDETEEGGKKRFSGFFDRSSSFSMGGNLFSRVFNNNNESKPKKSQSSGTRRQRQARYNKASRQIKDIEATLRILRQELGEARSLRDSEEETKIKEMIDKRVKEKRKLTTELRILQKEALADVEQEFADKKKRVDPEKDPGKVSNQQEGNIKKITSEKQKQSREANEPVAIKVEAKKRKRATTTAVQVNSDKRSKKNQDGGNNPFSIVQSAVSNVFSRSSGKEQWEVVFPKTRISPGEVIPVVVGGLDLLIVASQDTKKIHCIANTCSHLGTPLETGPIERRPRDKPFGHQDEDHHHNNGEKCLSECIVCPLHQTAFELETGDIVGEWCPYPPIIGPAMGRVKPPAKLPIFDIRVRGKNIEVRINSLLSQYE